MPQSTAVDPKCGKPISASVDVSQTLASDKASDGEIQKGCFTSRLRGRRAGLLALLVIAFGVCSMLFYGRDHIQRCMALLEHLDTTYSILIFLLLFILVSFPFCVAYDGLLLGCGYTYGSLRGMAVSSMCAACGVVVAHLCIRKVLRNCVEKKYIPNGYLKALMTVLSGNQGLRLVLCSRLTPIPFGLQNSLFAVSTLPTLPYLIVSTVGLLPMQALVTYLGSTLHSMEEMFSHPQGSSLRWLLLFSQIILAVCLAGYVLKKAKKEIDEAVKSQEVLPAPDKQALNDIVPDMVM